MLRQFQLGSVRLTFWAVLLLYVTPSCDRNTTIEPSGRRLWSIAMNRKARICAEGRFLPVNCEISAFVKQMGSAPWKGAPGCAFIAVLVS
jgi:hypothetical protein